jgi:hypothetical protein
MQKPKRLNDGGYAPFWAIQWMAFFSGINNGYSCGLTNTLPD